ncbi:hypothetical protein C3L33_19669, partial [Rhododendron williamsianum]
MALRAATLKSAGEKMMSAFGPIRWAHAIAAQPPPLDSSMGHAAVTAPFVLPELDRDSVDNNGNAEYGFPSFSFGGGGSMELMAVPKRKVDRDDLSVLLASVSSPPHVSLDNLPNCVSPHKRGIRNGPKALKPVPVIIRCKHNGMLWVLGRASHIALTGWPMPVGKATELLQNHESSYHASSRLHGPPYQDLLHGKLQNIALRCLMTC